MADLVVVVTATGVAGDHYVGRDFGWIFAMLPMVAYVGYLFVFRRQRASN